MSDVTAQQVVEVIRPLTQRSGLMNIDTTTPLLSSGVIDSLGIAELGEILSSAFSVHISIDQLGFDNADTPEQLAEIVSKAT